MYKPILANYMNHFPTSNLSHTYKGGRRWPMALQIVLDMTFVELAISSGCPLNRAPGPFRGF